MLSHKYLNSPNISDKIPLFNAVERTKEREYLVDGPNAFLEKAILTEISSLIKYLNISKLTFHHISSCYYTFSFAIATVFYNIIFCIFCNARAKLKKKALLNNTTIIESNKNF